MNPIIEGLVRNGIFERVPADPRTAGRTLDEAARHVMAAQRIADVDRSGAYVLCYDAARKAVAAMLLAEGFRAMAVPGSHTAIARAATSLASTPAERARLRKLNRMRQHRNRSEYAIRAFSVQEAAGAIDLATWIIEFARERLGRIES